jgi:hypothetical protein
LVCTPSGLRGSGLQKNQSESQGPFFRFGSYHGMRACLCHPKPAASWLSLCARVNAVQYVLAACDNPEVQHSLSAAGRPAARARAYVSKRSQSRNRR